MSIIIKSQEELSNVKFAELANIYNAIARVLGSKEIKKFRDKSTGIARILKIQEEYKAAQDEFSEEFIEDIKLDGEIRKAVGQDNSYQQVILPMESAPAPEKAKKGGKRKLEDTQYLMAAVNPGKGKEGGAWYEMWKIVSEEASMSVKDAIEKFVETYQKPRSSEPVTEQFARSLINWMVKEGKLI